jgi:hypothetical protein
MDEPVMNGVEAGENPRSERVLRPWGDPDQGRIVLDWPLATG